MILDASFLVDLLAGETAAVAKLDEIRDRRLLVPTLVYTEVAVGIDETTAAGQTFEHVMESVTLVPYDAEAARRAVGIQRQLYRDGEPIGAVDAMIAGVAIARDERIVTRNVDEFARTPATVSPY